MPKAETITSAANPLLKEVRRAIAHGGLTRDGLCVAETFHLLEDALGSGCEVKSVLVSESAEPQLGPLAGVKVSVLPDRLLESISATESAQGVIALVRPPIWTMEQLLRGTPLVVLLDGIQDPGNAGAILRAAEAFGATGAIFLKGSVSPHNPKTLRAAAGSLFRLPYVYGVDAAAARGALRAAGVRLYATMPAAERTVAEADLAGPCGLIVGSEAHGVGEGLRAAGIEISIPTAGVESLNAAVAAGIVLYEARRQRTAHL